MIRGFLKSLGLSNSEEQSRLPRAYRDDAPNFIYNLLFCDHPELFRSRTGDASIGDLLVDGSPKVETVQQIANDAAEESRNRALAFNWLRRNNVAVPQRIVLGVVVEVPQQLGLDTLAAYDDSSLRYINHSGRMAIFEAAPSEIAAKAKELMRSARAAVEKIGPWEKPRLPPPPAGAVRLTFIASDGLYFGQGPFHDIARDPIGGPVLKNATDLLVLVTQLGSARTDQI